MIVLRLDAPFAACRPMAASWYRPTSPTLTPSAAYGLLLNVACFEMRLHEENEAHDGKTPSSLVRPLDESPRLRLAMGIPKGAAARSVQSIYQQLHNYPVGRDAGVDPEWTKGAKNNISPVRREYLSDLRLLLAVDADDAFEQRVRKGLAGEFNDRRYGLPFVGDNAFLPDRLCELASRLSARWYERIDESTRDCRESRTARLTVWIDRVDMSRTSSGLFAPADSATTEPPEFAWMTLPPESA